jgi:hypothetical protein
MPFDILFALISFLTLVLAWIVLPGEGRPLAVTATAPAVTEPSAA